MTSPVIDDTLAAVPAAGSAVAVALEHQVHSDEHYFIKPALARLKAGYLTQGLCLLGASGAHAILAARALGAQSDAAGRLHSHVETALWSWLWSSNVTWKAECFAAAKEADYLPSKERIAVAWRNLLFAVQDANTDRDIELLMRLEWWPSTAVGNELVHTYMATTLSDEIPPQVRAARDRAIMQLAQDPRAHAGVRASTGL